MYERFLSGHTTYDFVLLFIAVIVMPAWSAFSGAQLSRHPPQARKLIPRYWQIVVRGWVVVGLVIGTWLLLGRNFAMLGLVPSLRGWDLAGFAAVALGVVVLVIQLLRLKSLPDKRLKKALRSLDRMKVAPTTGGELAVFMAVAVTAGVWEELVYRGFLIWFLAPVVGLAGAMILSSFIFGMGHAYQGAPGVAVTTFVGFMFALLYILSGSLWWLMAAHALIDVYGGLVAWRLQTLATRRQGAQLGA